jgi:hypothetical protein
LSCRRRPNWGRGQPHRELSAAVRYGAGAHLTAVGTHDLTNHCQTETRAAGLEREIWFEDPLGEARWKPRTIVDNHHFNASIGHTGDAHRDVTAAFSFH